MKARQLEKMGVPRPLSKMAKWLFSEARQQGMTLDDTKQLLADIIADPNAFREHNIFGELARELSLHQRAVEHAASEPTHREGGPAPYQQWGDDLDPKSVQQMQVACTLPVAQRGALMPDAHVGYGLPIGGVLATKNAVIPYAVGVDIACRVKLSVFDLPVNMLKGEEERLTRAIETETRFGIGARFGKQGDRIRQREHPVLDDDWGVSPITMQNRDKAATQLGTSGSGNHFVEFGELTIDDDHARWLSLPAGGTFLALLSHSGSRGTGAAVCDHYSKLAMMLHPNLPREAQHLAWLNLDTHEGQEYWQAMNLMGKYASANHACIHDAIARHLGATIIAGVENHHNFAWQEQHDGEELIIHRKGATPAGRDVLGIIPGSMASSCYVVRGMGNAASMHSAAHGAGRVMSRRQAKLTYRWSNVRPELAKRGVKLISAGLDEVPFVYKDIDQVMALQQDLVQPIARFMPRLVKMAPEGERAED